MKKLTLLVPLFAVLFLVGCGNKKEVVQQTVPVENNQPVEKEQANEPAQAVNKKDVAEEDHPHDGTEPDDHHDEEDSNNHGDTSVLFEGVTFSTSTEHSIDGYDITIKHKDDIHAGEKITWTITVTQGGEKLDGFEKIDGDDGVGLVKDPVDHIEHLHPLAFTDNTLTFSSHSHDAGTYEIITQFKHNGNVVTIPYTLDLLENIEGHGH